ncbi:peptidase M23 [Cereibacter changlensis JA139]|jgi:septal ring factor EnvC (AmiA/AmiB activator)|uniref:Peptidase M23 n=2 Tax=Cereibacter changlensis TaxID=402884 RepID=A0A2T4JYJ6_9RHOB|nr:peptidoglycan DD-metalloendopeptidase family protein [Cereibacter changlensis]MBZ4689796.1 peptidase [Cereibacter sp.]PTE22833.1 peptidase M23 [Cereibacter changlensis JA139]PZX58767.1 septal ring factor EnvC (AmiA/AmiB activator) [Cereibacter changlensis]
MIRPLALLLLLATPAAAVTVAEQAAQAAAELQEAVAELQAAETARDRVSSLTRTIQAYEQGLGALRENLRQASIREATLAMQFEAKREEVSQLLGVLARLDPRPGPLLLMHPSGPLGTARSGMMLADVTPALQAEAETLRGELQELRDLRALQASAGTTLAEGLEAAQQARTALSQAISDRTPLPRRFTESPEALKGLLESADTLDAFANGLSIDVGAEMPDFAAAKGKLPLPVLGTLLRRANESDAAGVRRPGVVIATRPRALVTAPWPGTVRYRGPLLDYGNVMILEPGGGYLLVLAGLQTVYGDVGDVVSAGAPLGLMGGGEPGVAEFLVSAQDGGGARETETLYMELRQGTEPVDPAEWFAASGE